MANYTSAAQMEGYLGVAFTPAQATQADVVAGAVTTWIDHRTGRSWQTTGAISGEVHQAQGNKVFLDTVPVVSVQTVDERGSTWPISWTPIPSSSYALTDAEHGVIELSTSYADQTVRCAYTVDITAPPPDLAFAATVLGADCMQTTLHPESAGLESIAVGQNDLTLKYASGGSASTPAVSLAVRVVDAYRRVVLA